MSDVQKSPWVELGLHNWIQNQLIDLKITAPNEIQRMCIPEILAGKDCIGCAKTGSGKTAVFAIPVLQKLSEDPYGVIALVLTPTRELASQIADQFKAFGQSIRVKVDLVVGGESSTIQSIKLSKKPHVVVATPGRLASILRENSEYFHFQRLKFLILDEVDALLSPGDFESDLSTILSVLPPAERRQTLAFSATSEGVVETLRSQLKPTLFIYVSPDKISTNTTLNEFYLLTPMIAKDAHLVYLLKQKLGIVITQDDRGAYITEKDDSVKRADRQAIVFTGSCWQCHLVGRILLKLGFKCSILHSALTQALRIKNLSNFRSRHTRILVSTSLAGRGLDIPCVDLVINLCLPFSPDEYIHHVGRTARAGRQGTAITFIAPFELDRLLDIEQAIGKRLDEYVIENEMDVDRLVKCCALLRKEISTNMFHNEDSKLNRSIERKKRDKKKLKIVK
ncbi:putative ATP-dependent RNA helicase DDX49 [Thelohanellus kitauei]|uniref:Putative ATP-dependent RNA helicase DDX49 n=1 Tax=Thelohanellus kitauei TaxID=669202 RepID=A0A0C2J106_THEKT|nr:putative ATP-dependent RNA helicase DDX49 [Thelohanellus kitauei]